MRRPFKIGLIGCGRIAQLVHLNILTSLPDVKLTALAEPDPERRREASRRVSGAQTFSSYEELLAKAEVEAVVICLPSALHAQAALNALRHGKHIYLEKPLATHLEEGREVIETWRTSGLVGMIGFNLRFNGMYQKARQCVQSKRLGELAVARSVFSFPPSSLPPWKQSLQSGGGVLREYASHHVDLVHFIFGEDVRRVFAQLRSQASEGDSAMLELELASGLVVQSFFSFRSPEEDLFEIYGRKGKFTADRHRPVGASAFWKKIFYPTYEPSYRKAFLHFLQAVRSNRPASPDLWDGFRSLAVIEAAHESVRTGQAVPVSEIYDPITCISAEGGLALRAKHR